jgi:hypothetical protein
MEVGGWIAFPFREGGTGKVCPAALGVKRESPPCSPGQRSGADSVLHVRP